MHTKRKNASIFSILHKFDSFASVAHDIGESTANGKVYSWIAVAVCGFLFVNHVIAFFMADSRQVITIDTNSNPNMRINFDVEMVDYDCNFLSIGVSDLFGARRTNITTNIKKTLIKREKGTHYTEKEIIELGSLDHHENEETSELDSWEMGEDAFEHHTLRDFVDLSDFTLINFSASWCSHCRQFHDAWEETANHVMANEYLDSDGKRLKIAMRAVDCVHDKKLCMDERVMGYPTVRVYIRSSTNMFGTFNGPRRSEDLLKFIKEVVSSRSQRYGFQHHRIFDTSCRVSGQIEVARVPGTLYFTSKSSAHQDVNLAYLNASHIVHHLSIEDKPNTARSFNYYFSGHLLPVDGKKFTVSAFHHVPIHYLSVMSTRLDDYDGLHVYQLTHQSRVATVHVDQAPTVKFKWDLSSVQVNVSTMYPWYDFLTSLAGLVGGAFTMISICESMTHLMYK